VMVDWDQDGGATTPDTDAVVEITEGDAMYWDGEVVQRYGEPRADALTRIQAETLPAVRDAVHEELQTQYNDVNREVYG